MNRRAPILVFVAWYGAANVACAEGLPTLEELAKTRWLKQPCVDFLEMHRKELREAPPKVRAAEALTLKNDGPDSNQKILEGLGRLPDSDAEVDWDATCRRFLLAEPSTLNPIFQSSRYEQWLVELLYATPIQPDRRFEHLGDLNEIVSWETSEDRLMDRIILRDDLKWSDGQPFTAQDIEFTFKVLTDPTTAREIPSLNTLASGLRAVKAYDARTVVYFQKEALATNHLHLVWPAIPMHIYAASWLQDLTLKKSAYHVKMNSAPVTSGPYRLVAWNKAQNLILERHDAWHQDSSGKRIRAKPFFKTVRFDVFADAASLFRAFDKGAVDETQMDSIQWTKQSVGEDFYKRNTKVRVEEWTFAYIGWCAKSNPPNPFFGDKRVRLAMTYALDHEFLLKELFFNLYRPGEGIFHPESPMADKSLKPFHQDLDRAEALLDEAGWRDSDGDGRRDKLIDGTRVPFEFRLSCPSVGTGPKVAQVLKENLEKIGVACQIDLMEFVTFQAAVQQHKVQAYLQAMGTGTDPDTLRNLWLTSMYDKGRNNLGYSNPRVDDLFESARHELDVTKRMALYAQIDRLIYEDHPMTILIYSPTLWGFSKSLRGYTPSPRGFANVLPGFFAWWKTKETLGSLWTPRDTMTLIAGFAAIACVLGCVFRWLRRRRTPLEPRQLTQAAAAGG